MPTVLHIDGKGPRLLDPEPMPGHEIVVGMLHPNPFGDPSLPRDWTPHAARMQDVDGVPHVVVPYWSRLTDS